MLNSDLLKPQENQAPSSSRPKWENFFLTHETCISVVFWISICIFTAGRLGQDANWDFRNYHFYIPYAFLNHRMGLDIASAQGQTWLNPAMYLPVYYLIRFLPSSFASACLAAVSGLNIAFIYLIAKKLKLRPIIRFVLL